MKNRLKHLLEPPDEQPPEIDYYEVVTDHDKYYVDRATADALSRCLTKRWPPRWLHFADIFGAAVSVLSRTVEAICECTGAQRELERAFRRERRKEEKEDWRPWEEDWW